MAGTAAESESAPGTPQETASNASASEKIVLEYLKSRGHHEAYKSLLESVEAGSQSQSHSESVSEEDLTKILAVFANKSSSSGVNALKDSSNALNEIQTMGSPVNIQELIASIGHIGAEEVLSQDPTDKHEGYRELEAWVDGSLDMYRPEFRPILFPIFCHFYLDLVLHGYKQAALRFYGTFSSSLAPSHSRTLEHFKTLLLPAHVQTDEVAERFRNEKYLVRMSRSGFGLLIGWLTEGIGGEALGSGDGFSGDLGKRGRAAVMRVVNNHLQFDVTAGHTTSVPSSAWEESTGLLSSLIPHSNGTSLEIINPQVFNSSQGSLKLGPAPLEENLRVEAENVLREQDATKDPSVETRLEQPTVPGLVSPAESDLLPRPPTFKTADIERELSAVIDARRRISLQPFLLSDSNAESSDARANALPSICAYTLHDVPEGAPCCTFSADSSMMATGFAESYIRLWNLRGEKLRGFRSDFVVSAIQDSNSIKKIREKRAATTRKLIGHSGPVYSVDFDPVSGSSAPPKHLLSSSADTTARLWSMDTLSNVAVFRGHGNPVWDVKWNPMGIYFATASRDRTARLWSTDRTSCLRVYAGHLSDVDCVQFHPNSIYLASGSADWTSRLWDVQRGACVRVFIGHQGPVTSLAISPDGRYLASAAEDLSINMWDLGSGKRIKKMTGHTSSIYSLAFSSESSLLVSGSADWTVKCWDVNASGGLPTKQAEVNKPYREDGIESSDLLATFPTKRTPITNVQFTPRNLCLVAGNYLHPDSR